MKEEDRKNIDKKKEMKGMQEEKNRNEKTVRRRKMEKKILQGRKGKGRARRGCMGGRAKRRKGD